MKIIAAGTLKGGTGKSMTVFQLSGLLSKKNKVLAIDADPQCNLTTNFGVDSTDLSRASIKTVFEDRNVDPEDVVLHAPIKALKQLDIIPSNIMLTETEMNLVSRSNRERLLENWISKNADYFDKYDYLICDTNPSMGLVNQNVFALADSIILVTDVDFNSIQGAQMFTYLWSKRREDLMLEDNVAALIVNNFDKRINLSDDLIDYVKNNDELSDLYIEPPINARVALKNSVGVACPVSVSSPESELSSDYKLLVKNLKKRGVL